MAQFTNQAQLSYNNSIVNSNIAVGEIVEVLAAAKTAVQGSYTRDDSVTYIVSGTNSGSTAISGVTVSDNLGAYTFGTETRVPQDYVENSARLFINGALATTPSVTEEADGSVTFSGITLPANSSFVLVYETVTNQFAPLGTADSITNIATISGAGISTPVAASVTLNATSEPELTITKSIEPVPVTENGVLTYRFIIQNYGNAPADAGDNVVLTDTFDPILTGLTVSYNSTPWAETTNYTYDDTTGLFSTVAGQIVVPAATYTQDPVTGVYTITPGSSTLTVTGTV